jgi:hypothetical protein
MFRLASVPRHPGGVSHNTKPGRLEAAGHSRFSTFFYVAAISGK